MKKHKKSKIVVAGVLAAFAAAVLVTCALWIAGGGAGITAEAVQKDVPEAPTENWTETIGAGRDTFAPPSNRAFTTAPAERTANTNGTHGFNSESHRAGNTSGTQNAFPKLVEVSASEVIVDFTNPQPFRAPPPIEAGTDPEEKPTEPPVESRQTRATPPEPTPAPGSANSSGEVYCPVFGWVRPGPIVVIDVDSDGDINRIIGNMN